MGIWEEGSRFIFLIVRKKITHQNLNRKIYISFVIGKYYVQIAVRAGGFSALVVVGMAVIGVAILYATFYVWLGVDSTGSMKVTDCK